MVTKKIYVQQENEKEKLREIGNLLRNGGLVAIPTETVYGLGASIFDEHAVQNIYKAKGRPSDNPLIVHVSDLEMALPLTKDLPEAFFSLAEAFWPGALTMVVPKSELVNSTVSGGLATVAIRMPAHGLARKIISGANLPLAAPSANTSGSPSPTKASHVVEDLDGKIDAIVMGEDCQVGIESTVISLLDGKVTLLRPGMISIAQLEKVVGKVHIGTGVLHPLEEGEHALSPGMKYKHYSPRAKVVLLQGGHQEVDAFLAKEKKVFALAGYTEDKERFGQFPFYCLGNKEDYAAVARGLFDLFRRADKDRLDILYILSPPQKEEFLGVYNRMVRAAGFQIITLT